MNTKENKPNFNNEVLAHGNTWKLLKIETQDDAYNKNYNLPSYVCVYKGEYVKKEGIE